MAIQLKVTYEGTPPFFPRVLRSPVLFWVSTWWAPVPLHSQWKEEYVTNQFDVPVDGFVRFQKMFGTTPVVELTEKPTPDGHPIGKGVTHLSFVEGSEPEPEPDPDRPIYQRSRAVVFIAKGTVPIIIKPSSITEALDVTIVQKSEAWFKKLDDLIAEEDNE